MSSLLFARLGLNNLGRFKLHTKGWFSVLIVIGVTFLLLISFGRVISNATNNYEVYEFERGGLSLLLGENTDLKQELDYYKSFEYKRLYARDYLHLAEPGETLYKIVGTQKYYEIENKDPVFVNEANYSYWWSVLF